MYTIETEKSNKEISMEERKEQIINWEFMWNRIMALIYIHIAGIYGFYLALFYAKLWTIIWSFVFYVAAMVGTTAGSHRLWSHRAYKAKWPLKLILTIFQTASLQGPIYKWVRDHRLHHKYTDTNADPYSAHRGFFFSHVGWVIIRKHPDVIKKFATIDYKDLEQDCFVVFQRKYYTILASIFCFILPTFIPYWAWNETLSNAWHLIIFSLCVNLNMIFMVNSVAHIWGTKPYDSSISSVQNPGVSFMACGEGWHNYHHVFPWDYRAAELGPYVLNFSTAFIDFFAYIGLAYDLKTAHVDIIKKRTLRNKQINRIM